MATELEGTAPAPPPPALDAPTALPAPSGFTPQPGSAAFPAEPGATAFPSQPASPAAPAAAPPRLAPYVALPPPPAGVVTPHIALLLPLDSQAFSRHAEAVRNGFFAASQIKGGTSLPVRVYATNDDGKQITEAYLRAVSVGSPGTELEFAL